jgi:hypothetical protein
LHCTELTAAGLAGQLLAESAPAASSIPSLLYMGTILFFAVRVLSAPFGFMSAYAAHGNVVLAAVLSVLWWYLSHCVVDATAAHPAVFNTAVLLWAAAFFILVFSDWVWPGELQDEEAVDWRRQARWRTRHDAYVDRMRWHGRGKRRPRRGFVRALGGLQISRDAALLVANGVLWVTPAVGVLGSMR